jgi:biotin carboxyl carrier protein
VRYRIAIEGRTFEIEVAPGGRVWVNRQPLSVDLGRVGGLPLYSLLLNHRSYETHVEAEDGAYRLLMAGRLYRVCFWEEQRPSTGMVHRHQRHEPVGVSAPLPGLLVEVRVAEGQRVGEGEVVAVLESMKMCLELRAPHSGVICALRAAAGQEVAQGDMLAVIEGPHDEGKSGAGR